MAGSKKDSFETDLLELIFNNTALTGIGDAGGLLPSSAAGNLYVALFPGASEPTDSVSGVEATYTNYTRVAVGRAASGWTVSNGACSNTAAITFPQCGASGETLGAFAICKGSTTGVDDAIYWGTLTSDLVVSSGITPEFAIGDLDITED